MKVRIDVLLLASSQLICSGETPLCYKTGPLARGQAGDMLGKQQNPGAKLSLFCPLKLFFFGGHSFHFNSFPI